MDKLEIMTIMTNVSDAKNFLGYAKTVIDHISNKFFTYAQPDIDNIKYSYNDIASFLNIAIYFLHDGIKLLGDAEKDFSLQNLQNPEPERETERR